MFSKLFVTKTSRNTIIINESQRAYLSAKKKLILGCGTDNFSHNEIHPSSDWLSLDVNPEVKPDITASAEVVDLRLKMEAENILPPNGYDVIYSEAIVMNVFSNPHFVKNIHDLLHKDGIFIADNLYQSDLNNFREYFTGVYAFFGHVIISKNPLTVDQILDKLESSNLTTPEMSALINKLKQVQRVCCEFAVSDPLIQQLIPAYLVVKKYLEIDAKQDLQNTMDQISKDIPLSTIIEKYPEFQIIVNENPILLDLINKKPYILTYIYNGLNKADNKTKILEELHSFSDENIEFLSQITKPFVNLTLLPRVFELGDDDDVENFLEQHKAGFFNSPDNQFPIFDKNKWDSVMKTIFDQLTHLFKTQDVTQLKELYNLLKTMTKQKYLSPQRMGYDADVNKAIVEWAYNADANYIFNSCRAIFDFVQHAIEKHHELMDQRTSVFAI